VRSQTIAPKRLTRDERKLSELAIYPDDVERPAMREQCAQMARPCPFVSCSHHLYLDVNEETGAIKLNFPHLEVWEMAETCSLDVADRGGITLEEVGAILNLTRERIRQVEVRGLAKIKNDDTGGELGVMPERY
jgi:Sigma-70, region 4